MRNTCENHFVNLTYIVYYVHSFICLALWQFCLAKQTRFRTLVKSVQRKTNFLISQPKHYVVGIHKSCLNEMILSTEKYSKTDR